MAAAAGPAEPPGEPQAPALGPRTAPSGGGGAAFPNNSGKSAVDAAASSAAWLAEESAVVRSVTFHGHWTKATEIPFFIVKINEG